MLSKTQQHGGKREGAGRPKGSPSKRTLAEIGELARLYPDWTPLRHFAHVANDKNLPADIRLDAAKAAAPYVHAKLKGMDGDPDAIVELEGRIHAARLHAAADALAARPGITGLADRLARADAREAAALAELAARPLIIVEKAEPSPAPEPEPEAALSRIQRANPDAGDSSIIAATPAAVYQLITPSVGDVEVDYDPTYGSYD